MKKNIEVLPLNRWKGSSKTQIRAGLSAEAVADYTEKVQLAIAAGQPIPFPEPVIFRDDEGNEIPAAGFHRVKAFGNAGLKEAAFEVRKGGLREAMEFALGDNQKHGVRMTKEDMPVAIARAFETWPDYSNVQIAGLVGCSEATVRRHKPAVAATNTVKTVIRKGKEQKMDVSGVGKGKGAKSKTTEKKEKVKAAKKDKKAAAKASKDAADPDAAAKRKEKLDAEIAGLVDKIMKKIDPANDGSLGFKSDKLRKAILDGTIPLPLSDLKTFATLTDLRARKVASLVLTGDRWPVNKAVRFIDEDLSEKTTFGSLQRLLGANGGAMLEEKIEGTWVFLVNPSEYTKEISPSGIITLKPVK